MNCRMIFRLGKIENRRENGEWKMEGRKQVQYDYLNTIEP
jgi:hypothetical protein